MREEQICEGARQRQMSVSGSLVPDDIHALRLQKTFLNLYNECAFFFFLTEAGSGNFMALETYPNEYIHIHFRGGKKPYWFSSLLPQKFS